MRETTDGTAILHPRYWPTWAGVALMRVASVLPLPVLCGIGVLLGELVYYLHTERRRVARTNIDRCFSELPAHARRRLTKQHFHAFGQCLLDIGIAWWGSKARLHRLIRFRGREHYDRALATGRGVILLAPHFVALDIGGIALSGERPLVSMYRHVKNRLIDRVSYRRRTRFGLTLFERNRGLKPIIKRIRSGLPFYYLPDQDLGRRHSVFVTFFGIPTATVPALGRIAQLTGAAVIVCATRQLPRGQGYEIIFGPPLTDFPTGDETSDVRRMNEEIERLVREMPEQYVWVHKRFKTRPTGEPKFYP